MKYYEELVGQASLVKSSTAAIRKQCWDRIVKTLRVLFDELHRVKAGARSAHILKDSQKQTSMFLHHTLQEVRVLEEFKADEFRNHPKVLANFLEHLAETY